MLVLSSRIGLRRASATIGWNACLMALLLLVVLTMGTITSAEEKKGSSSSASSSSSSGSSWPTCSEPTSTTVVDAAASASSSPASSSSSSPSPRSASDVCPLRLRRSLQRLGRRLFFRYFKVDLVTPCPHWLAFSYCSGGCHVLECDDEQVPQCWEAMETQQNTQVENAPSASSSTTTIVADPSSATVATSSTPSAASSSGNNASVVEDSVLSQEARWLDKPNGWTQASEDWKLSYINLQDYPESHTGYGQEAVPVWNAIYGHNCIQKDESEQCFEEKVFMKILSGLHASINTHVFRNYQREPLSNSWIPTVDSLRGFEKSILAHPERIENLHVAFSFLLRALAQVEPQLRETRLYTGNAEDDLKTRQAMADFLSLPSVCDNNAALFDESAFFDTQSLDKAELKIELRETFRNISGLMNCVTCTKCKVWGKLQTTALGAAFNLLVESGEGVPTLERNEIIALIITTRQFANSIWWIEELRTAVDKLHAGKINQDALIRMFADL